MRPKWLEELLQEQERGARKIGERIGLDIDDPEVIDALTGVDFETFNQRLDELIKRKGNKQ